MCKVSISKKKNPTPEKGIRKNEKEEAASLNNLQSIISPFLCSLYVCQRVNVSPGSLFLLCLFNDGSHLRMLRGVKGKMIMNDELGSTWNGLSLGLPGCEVM
jgi:hypothetical protein